MLIYGVICEKKRRFEAISRGCAPVFITEFYMLRTIPTQAVNWWMRSRARAQRRGAHACMHYWGPTRGARVQAGSYTSGCVTGTRILSSVRKVVGKVS